MMLFLEDCDGLSDEQFFDSRRRRRERSMSSSDAFLLLLFGCRLLSQAKPGTSFQVSAEIRSMRTKLLLRRSYGTSPYHTQGTSRPSTRSCLPHGSTKTLWTTVASEKESIFPAGHPDSVRERICSVR